MPKYSIIISFVFVLIVTATGQIAAEVTPEIQLGARGVMSLNADIRNNQATNAVSDFSDTDLMFGFRQKMYSKLRGQLVIGFQFPDAESDLGQVFFHQTFIKLENKSNIIKIGRSRVKTTLLDFPMLRDDDALLLTTTLNPFSDGKNSEDHQYGNVLEYTHLFSQRYQLQIHAEHFRKAPDIPGTAETDFGLNAVGFVLQYRIPNTQRWNRSIIQSISIGTNNFLTDRPNYSGEYDQALKNILLGFVINIKPDPVHFWDIRSQTIYNTGFEEVQEIVDFSNLARAKAIGNFTSLRYLYRKMERPLLQVALSAGYKKFPNAIQPSKLFQIATSLFYRIGENFDVGLQVQFEDYSGDLKQIYGANETRIQFSFIYSVDKLWNNQFDDRESLLNLEHGYIP